MTGEEMDASISQSDHSTGKHILGDIIGTSEEQGSGVVKGEDERKVGEELTVSNNTPLQDSLATWLRSERTAASGNF